MNLVLEDVKCQCLGWIQNGKFVLKSTRYVAKGFQTKDEQKTTSQIKDISLLMQ